MHLPREELGEALSQLRRLLREGGRALISVRGPRGAQRSGAREGREGGRLFTQLSEAELRGEASAAGLRVLYTELLDVDEQGKRWLTLIVERQKTSITS